MFAAGKPADYFTETQARDALDAADEIIRFCEGHLPDRTEALRHIRTVACGALTAFPELQEVRVFGSLAAGTQTGTSDVDLFLLLNRPLSHPVEGLKPYFFFFSKRLDVALDIIAGSPEPPAELELTLRGSIVLVSRQETVL